jgi:ATP/maltotriose-dependent transcriptional regulator MalT
MTQSPGTLVGRDDELALIDRLLAGAQSGAARFATIGGEPGIGKTRLLDEAARRARARGFLVLEGRAAEFERELPFALVIDAFDRQLASLDAHEVERLLDDGLSELAPVIPCLRPWTTASEAALDVVERFRVHHALRELVERLAGPRRLLLAFDDLHWADDPSVELVAHLIRRNPRAGVLVVVTFRSGQLPEAVAAAVRSTAHESPVDEISLAPLDRDAVRRLVDDADAASSAAVYEQSGGNPFYVEQLLRARAAGRAADGATAEVPPAVAATIEAEVRILPGDARTLIEAASVVGDPFELDLAVETSALDEARAMDALDVLVARGLLHAADAPRRFAFRHPLVRDAVYQAFPPGSRLSAHSRAAAALAARGAPAVIRARHLEVTARPGDRDAIAGLREAGQAVTASAPHGAVRWLGRALDLLPAEAGHAERAELLDALATAQTAAGQPLEALATLEQLLEVVPAPGRIQVMTTCAVVEHLVGRHDAARDRLTSALELAGDDAGARARGLLRLAAVAVYRGDYAEMDRLAREAERQGDATTAAKCAAALAYAAFGLGDVTRARAELDRAARLVSELDDDAVAADVETLLFIASVSAFLARYRDARAYATRAVAAMRHTGRERQFMPVMLCIQGGAERFLGDLGTGAAILDDAIELARLGGDPQGLVFGLSLRADIALIAGDLHLALACGEEVVEFGESLNEYMRAAWVPLHFAPALIAAGQARRARDMLLSYGGGDRLPLVPLFGRGWLYALLAMAATELGALGEAKNWLDCAEAEGVGARLAPETLAVRQARVLLLAARDEQAVAAAEALEGAAAADEAEFPIEAAGFRLAAGKALAADGRRDEALRELERAEVALAAHGAERLRAEASRELRRLGRRTGVRLAVPASDGHGLAALSPREREVAALVRRRRTNPQIAEALFLSLKTVETHMRNIFRKLEVSSRIDVAELVEREERESGAATDPATRTRAKA